MVCLDDGIICVPKHSNEGVSRCLPSQVKCDGKSDCQFGIDEEDCPLSLPVGLQVLVALAVIAVLILVPVLYACIRRKQGKPAIPKPLRPIFDRLTQLCSCCSKLKGRSDRSGQELTENHSHNVSSSPGFETSPNPAPTQIQNYSKTGRPLNKFRQAVNEDELERAPSFRDWQANRLQQQPRPAGGPTTRPPGDPTTRPSVGPTATAPGGSTVRPPGDSTARPAAAAGPYDRNVRNNNIDNRINHTVEINRVNNGNHNIASDRRQPHAVTHHGPVTYVPGARRAEETAHNAPYSIATQSGRGNYEVRSHLQTHESDRTQQTNQQYSRNRYTPQRRYNEPPPTYDSYAYNSSAVRPTQLRQALEQVAATPSSGASGYQRGTEYDASEDTVV